MKTLEQIEMLLERKATEKSSYLDKIAEMRTKVKQNEEETAELENQRILAVVAMSDIDIRQLKDMLSGIKTSPVNTALPPVPQEHKFERKLDDENE